MLQRGKTCALCPISTLTDKICRENCTSVSERGTAFQRTQVIGCTPFLLEPPSNLRSRNLPRRWPVYMVRGPRCPGALVCPVSPGGPWGPVSPGDVTGLAGPSLPGSRQQLPLFSGTVTLESSLMCVSAASWRGGGGGW